MFDERETEFDEPRDLGLLAWIWRFLRPYRGYIALAIVLMPVYSAFSLAQPYVIKLAIDLFITPASRPHMPGWLRWLSTVSPARGILLAGAVYALLVLGEFVSFYGQYFLTMLVAQLGLSDLRVALFRHIEKLPMAFFDREPSGRLVSRVTTDIDAIGEMFNSGALTIFSDGLVLLSVVVLMFRLSPVLASVTLLTTLPLLLIVKVLQVQARRVYREIRRRLAALSAYLSEAIEGMTTIQLFTREDRSLAEFDEFNSACRDALRRANIYEAGLYSLVEAASSICVGVLLWRGGYRGVSLGTLVAFVEYVQKFFVPLRDMSTKYAALQSALAAVERIVEVMLRNSTESNYAPALRLGRPPSEIRFEHVSFSYRPGEKVLHDLSFCVEPGQKVAIVGPTGAGKSTIIKLLVRFYDPQEGRILLDGVDLRKLDLSYLRRVVGIVQQEVFIFSGTIADNVRMGRDDISEAQVIAALKRAQAYDFVARLPLGLNQPIGEKGLELSSGQRQLLAFARALAFDPPILVMDEATSSVDPETERWIQCGLEELLQGRTALIIAHRLSTIQKADQILVISHGTLREKGTHQELIAKRGLYWRLFELQYGSVEKFDSTVSAM